MTPLCPMFFHRIHFWLKFGNKSELESLQGLSVADMYKSKWKHVQILANQIWKHWSSKYLHNLQSRQKWTIVRPHLKENNIALLIDESMTRNLWPVGLIDNVFPSSDELVRKLSVRVIKDWEPDYYTRPITKLVHLMSWLFLLTELRYIYVILNYFCIYNVLFLTFQFIFMSMFD